MKRSVLGALISVVAIGCGGDSDDGDACGDGVCLGESNATCPIDCPATGPFCGDGTCNGSETTSSCPEDCGAACSTSNDQCAGETICVSSACVAAFPRVYSITNVAVSVPTTNPNNGEDWDVGGGAPDLFLGDMNGTPFTASVPDQFSASFAGPFDVQLVAGATLRIDVWDEDVTVNDFAFACQEMPITAARLRARVFGCAGNGLLMSSSINPK